MIVNTPGDRMPGRGFYKGNTVDKPTDSKVFELIAETLIEIRDEMRRNRPAIVDVQSHPERVRRVKDLKHPSEPYRPMVPQVADLVPVTR